MVTMWSVVAVVGVAVAVAGRRAFWVSGEGRNAVDGWEQERNVRRMRERIIGICPTAVIRCGEFIGSVSNASEDLCVLWQAG